MLLPISQHKRYELVCIYYSSPYINHIMVCMHAKLMRKCNNEKLQFNQTLLTYRYSR